jgi:hypothetical protein
VSLGLLVTFIIVLLGSGTRYPFFSFPPNPLLNYFLGESGFHPFFSPLLYLMLCNYVLDWLVGGFNCLFIFLALMFML